MSKKKKEDVLETANNQATEDDVVLEEDVELDEPELTELEQLVLQVTELQDEVARLKNEYLKEKAEVENIRKRLEKERIVERKYAAMPVAKAFISPLDHFELALKHAPEDETTKSYVQGFAMILSEIQKGLESVGVSEIDANDCDYDPNFHQAVMVEHVDGMEPNKVIDVLQKGYMFKDRVIRPAMVKISE